MLREEGDQSIDYLPKSTHAKTKSTGGIQMCLLVSISICPYLLKQRGFNLKMKKSKHLKGQLGTPVNNVTLLDQKRSVGDSHESRYVFFFTKGGQLDPRTI